MGQNFQRKCQRWGPEEAALTLLPLTHLERGRKRGVLKCGKAGSDEACGRVSNSPVVAGRASQEGEEGSAVGSEVQTLLAA